MRILALKEHTPIKITKENRAIASKVVYDQGLKKDVVNGCKLRFTALPNRGAINGKTGLSKLIESFSDMPDPRVVGRTDHHLLDILVLTVCAVVCGADDWEAVEMWGDAKLDWLRQYIPLK